ncbi:MAG: hemerythrin domain-containing protein [Nitrospirae bacterium]|nr:hemerythrin domain-containing protein [Nitrospirota bacterium]
MAKNKPKNSSKQSDAVQMLKADHNLFKKLFDQFHTASADEKPRIANRLITELTIHASLEKDFVYPAVQSKLVPADRLELSVEVNGLGMSRIGEDENRDFFEGEGVDRMKLDADEEEHSEEVIAQAYEEHQRVEELIEQLKTFDPQGPDYRKLFTQLEDAVLEHIGGEEDVILRIAALQLDVQALGVAMRRRRDDLSSSLAA